MPRLRTFLAFLLAVGPLATAGSVGAEEIDIAQPLPMLLSTSPGRLVDTRPTGTTVDGQARGGGRVRAATGRQFTLAGRGGARADAAGLVLNVTVTGAAAPGRLFLWRCGAASSTRTVLHFNAGAAVANTTIVRLGAAKLCVGVSADVHVIVDLVSQFGAGSGYTPGGGRLVDTRAGVGGSGGALQAGQWRRFAATIDRPLTFVNATVRGATRSGFLAIQTCDGGLPNWVPTSSSLNVGPGSPVSNLLSLWAPGEICVYSSVAADIEIDLVGGSDPARWPPVAGHDNPFRQYDTRPYPGGPGTPLAAGEVRQVADLIDIPGSAGMLLANVTAVGATGPGYITLFACDQPANQVSTFNVAGPAAVAHFTFVPMAADGSFCIRSSVSTSIVLDTMGWYDVVDTQLTLVAHRACNDVRAPAVLPLHVKAGTGAAAWLQIEGGVAPIDIVVNAPAGWSATTEALSQGGPESFGVYNVLVLLAQDPVVMGGFTGLVTVSDAAGASVELDLNLLVTAFGPIPGTC